MRSPMDHESYSSSLLRICATLAWLCAFPVAENVVRAADIVWTGEAGDNRWNTGDNWFGGIPTSADNVALEPGVGNIVLLTGNPGATNDFTLNGALLTNLNDPGANLTVNGEAIVGSGAEASITVGARQGSTAVLEFKKSLVLGTGQGGFGTLSLGKGDAELNITASLIMGQSGAKGSVSQTGKVTIGDNVYIGDDSDQRSDYSFAGATADTALTIGQTLIVGRFANADFTHSQGTLRANSLILGIASANRAPTATYTFSGGNLSIAQDEMIGGDEATGTFTQEGASVSHIVRGNLVIAKKGTFEMNSGTLVVTGDLTIRNLFEQRKVGQVSEVTISGALTVEQGAQPYQLISGDLLTQGDVDLRQLIQVKEAGRWFHNGRQISGQGAGGAEIDGGGLLRFEGGVAQTLDQIPIQNGGTIEVANGAGLQFANSASITNSGTLDIQGDFNLAGTGVLNTSGTVKKSAGTGTATIGIAANVTGGTFEVQTGIVEVSGALSITDQHVQKTGPGALTISGVQSHGAGGGIDVNAGTLNMNTDAAGQSGIGYLTLRVGGSGSQINLNAPQCVSELYFTAGGKITAARGGQCPVTAWDVHAVDAWGDAGFFDINDNTVTVTGVLNGAFMALRRGYQGGFNTTGIGSSLALETGQTLAYTQVGYTTTIMLAKPGDMNLDGKVDDADLAVISAHLDGYGPWTYGDMNFDQLIDSNDVTLWGLLNNHGSDGNLFVVNFGNLPSLIQPPTTLALRTDAAKSFAGPTLNNQGTLSLEGTGDLTLSNGAVLNNTGTFDVQRDGNVLLAGTGGGSLVNAGILRKSAGTGIATIPAGVAFTNPGGSIDVLAGTLKLDNSFAHDAGLSLTKTGSGTFNITGSLYLGGTIDIQAGILSTSAGNNLIGAGGGAEGLLQIGQNADAGSQVQTNVLTVGSGGTKGKVIQYTGTIAVQNLDLCAPSYGWDASEGTYELHGGSFTASGQLTSGSTGPGTFTQTGGTATISGNAFIGYNGTGSGTLNVQGEGAPTFTTDGALLVGWQATGTVNQSAGGVNAKGGLTVGYGSGTGTYNLSGGTLNVGNETVGWQAVTNNGTFNQTGGTANTGGLSSTGTYNLSGGTLNVGNETVGWQAVTNNGTFNQTGGTANAGDFGGTGTLTVGGDGIMNVNHVRQASLTVNSTGRVNIRPTGASGIGPGLPGGTSVVNSVSMALDGNNQPTGKIDLNNNHLIIDSADPDATITALVPLLRSGYNSDSWNGPGIMTSKGSWHYSIGMGDNRVLGYSTFGGQTVSSTATLLRFTLSADADLDGTVSFADMSTYSQHYGQSGVHWWEGDFTYDGLVNFSDMVKMNQTYGETLTEPGMMMGNAPTGGINVADYVLALELAPSLHAKIAMLEPEHLAEFDEMVAQWRLLAGQGGVDFSASSASAPALSPVPEPGSALLVLAGMMMLGARRRRA